MPMSQEQYQEESLNILRKMASTMGSNYRGSSISSSTISSLSAGSSKIDSVVNTTFDTMDKLGSASDGVSSSFNVLSRSGTNFSNDLIAMKGAAIETRQSMGEMAYFFAEQGKNMAGLGGSVTRGAEQFSKFSDELHKQSAPLRYLGMNTKEINNMLAYQVGMQHVINMNDAIQRKRTLDSVIELSTEMDGLSKITGRSREEFLQELNDKKVRSAFDARMELLRRTMSEEQFSALAKATNSALINAEATGHATEFLEAFSSGTIKSDKGAMGVATGGSGHVEEAMLLRAGKISEAQELLPKAHQQALSFAMSDTALELTTVNDKIGGFGESLLDTQIKTRGLQDGLQSIAQQNKLDLQTQEGFNRAVQIQAEQVKTSQQGVSQAIDLATGRIITTGKDVGQITRAAADVTKTQQDASAGLYKSFNEITTAGFTAADGLRKLADGLSSLLPSQPEKSIEDTMQKISNYVEGFVTGTKEVGDAINDTKSLITITIPSVAVEFASKISNAATEFKRILLSPSSVVIPQTPTPQPEQPTNQQTSSQNSEPPGRASGSLGMTGSLIENFGKGSLTMLHGKEGVLTQDQQNNLASGSMMLGIQHAIESNMNTIQSFVNQPTLSGNVPVDMSPMISIVSASIADISNTSHKTMIDTNLGFKKSYEQFIDIIEKSDITDVIDKSFKDGLKNITDFAQHNSDITDVIDKSFKDGLKNITDFAQHNSDINVSTPNNPNNGNLSAFATDLMSTKNEEHNKSKTSLPKSSTSTIDNKTEQSLQTELQEQTKSNVIKQTDVLSNILTQIENLNKNFQQFMTQHERIGKKQISATKQNSGNLYHG